MYDYFSENTTGLDIVIVFDNTGSMSSGRSEINALMDALLTSVNFGPEVKIALISFVFNFVVDWDLNSTISTDPPEIASRIAAMALSSGGYAPYGAFVQAREILDTQARSSADELVIFFYDGREPTTNAHLVRDMFER